MTVQTSAVSEFVLEPSTAILELSSTKDLDRWNN